MTTPFGPQLLGETEKALGALLGRFLAGSDLSEREWVTMRVAHQSVSASSSDDLTRALTERAHFTDAHELVRGLTDRGLLDRGRPTPAGRELTALVQDRVDTGTAAIWNGLPDDEVTAATRVLNEVVGRARSVLAQLA